MNKTARTILLVIVILALAGGVGGQRQILHRVQERSIQVEENRANQGGIHAITEPAAPRRHDPPD